MPLPYLHLLATCTALFTATLAARWLLPLLAPLLKQDAHHRLTASLASILVLGCVRALGCAHGCAALLGYMAGDLLNAAVLGPRMAPVMVAHHAATVFLTSMGLVQMDRDTPALRGMLHHTAAALMWMEATNPFLHACTLVTSEAALAPLQRYVLPAAAPGLVLSFFWFRVVALPLLLPDIWRFRSILAPLTEVYIGVVAALAALQLYWFWKILAKMYRSLREKSVKAQD